MKRVLFLLALLASSVAAFGQTIVRYDDIAINQIGVPVPNVSVWFCNQPAIGFPCVNQVTFYTDSNPVDGTVTQPVTGDQYGNYHLYTTPGVYTRQFEGGGQQWSSTDFCLQCAGGGGGGGGGGIGGGGTAGSYSGFSAGATIANAPATFVGHQTIFDPLGAVIAPDVRTANFPVFDIRAHGMTGDGIYLATCSGTVGTAVVACTGANFQSTDVGKLAALGLAGTSGAQLVSTILAVNNSTTVTLSNNLLATVSAAQLFYGTDNSPIWCGASAFNCSSATSGNVYLSPQPGRTVLAPSGMYLFSTDIGSRGCDQVQGAGQSATNFVLVGGGNTLLHMGAYDNSGTWTADPSPCGANVGVSGILFATPFSATQVCVDPSLWSGWTINENWFECGVGVSVTGGNSGEIAGNTFDSNNWEAVSITDTGSNNYLSGVHTIDIHNNQIFANRIGVLLGGTSGVSITDNRFWFNFTEDIVVGNGTSTSTKTLRVSGNEMVTHILSSVSGPHHGYDCNNNYHIVIQAPLWNSNISGNTLNMGHNSDIYVTTGGSLVNSSITANNFKGACESGECTNSCAGQTAGTGQQFNAITMVNSSNSGAVISNNTFDSPGGYAARILSPVTFTGNSCNNPFTATMPSSGDYNNGCFTFINSGVAGSVVRNNSTSSTTVAAVVASLGATGMSVSDNRSGWTYDAVFAGSTNDSWNETDELLLSASTPAFLNRATGAAGFTSATIAGTGAGWTNYGYGTVPGVPASGTTFSMPASGVPMVVVWPGALPTGTSQTFNVTGITGSTISLGWGASGGGGGMVYPGAGVPCSNGSAWCTSYALGTSANDLVQLNGSGFFPAINGSLLTGITFTQLVGSLAHGQLPTLLSGDIPNNAANTTGNSATATALAGTPGLCTTGNAPTGILPNGNATGCASITGGGGGVGGSGTVGRLPAFVTNTTTLGNSHIDDGITTSGVVTSTEPVAAPSISVQTSSSTAGFTDPGVTADPSALAVGNRWFRSDLARLSNYDGANVQRGSQLHDFDSFMWPTTGSQRSMVGALETMFFNSASPNSVAVDGDSIYAGIATGGGPTINVITDRVREVLQLRGDAGPGIVNVCTVFGSCQKSTLPPGTTWTPAGSLTYEFNGTGTPIGIATQDVYNTTAADTSAGGTMTCSECTVMVAMFEGLNTLGTGTCTFDGSATGACSGGFTTVTGSSTPSLITLTLTAASGIPASHTFVWHDATGTVRFLGLIATTNRQGATVFNNAIGSSTAAEIHGAHSGTYTAMFQSQVALENPDHVIIGSTGINECVAGTTPASYRTSLHSLYGDWLAAAPNASIVFAGGPDASTCTTYAEGLYREQMAEEALADGVPFLDVYGTYSPYTAVRLMCHGATCYQAGIEPHLNLAAGDAVALSIVDKITDPAADPHTGGASLVMQSHGALQECYQPGLGPPAQYYGSVQTSSGCIKASTANATAGLPIRPCEYNCAGTSGTGTALIGISGWQTVMFDSTSATYGHWVTPSTATAGEYTDTGSVTFPAPPGSGCLYVAGQVELVPASVPGIGKIDTTNAQQICATGSGSGITYAATPTANTVLTSASSSTAGAVAPNPLIDSTGRMIMPGNGTNAGQIDMIIGACQGVTASSVGICAPNAGSGYVVKLPSAGPVTGLWYATSSAGTVQMSAVTALPSGITGANLTGVPLTTGVTGILPPANGGNGVANTATDTLGTSNQNWGTLATGIVFNTTTTGAQTIVTVGSGLSLTGSTLTASASAPLWSGMGNPTANLTLSMGSNLSEFDTTTALSQFVSWKNKTAAVVGTSQGSPVNVLCGRAWHGSADVEDCLTLSELPGNGNDAAIAFNIGHTGTSTGTVTTNFPGPIAAGVSGGVGGTLTLPEGTAPTGIASSDLIYADSTAHRAKQIANNGTAAQLVNSGADINTSDQVTVTHLASPLPIAQGGTATGSPALVAGTNVTITGTWPNQTINSSGGGGSAPSFPVNPQTATYQVLAADFSSCKTITIASGTFTVTLVASSSQPANGQCIWVENYGSGTITIAPSGQNINGGSSSLSLGAGLATAPTAAFIQSDGTNYFGSVFASAGATGVTSIVGTTNQVALSASTGAVTASLPSNIIPPGTVTFPAAGTGTLINQPCTPTYNTSDSTDKKTGTGSLEYFATTCEIPANAIVANKTFLIHVLFDVVNGATRINGILNFNLCGASNCASGTNTPKVIATTPAVANFGAVSLTQSMWVDLRCTGTAAAGATATITCGVDGGVTATLGGPNDQSGIILNLPTNGALYVVVGDNLTAESGSYVSILSMIVNYDN